MAKRQKNRCYFCAQVGVSEAYSTDICMRHQALISLKFIVLLVRRVRFSKFWKIVRWWK